MRIVTCNLPQSYITAMAKLTGKDGLYPSRSELIRVAVREWLLKELEEAKKFQTFQEQISKTPFSQEKEDTEDINEPEEKFEINIDAILGITETKEEPMASDILYKTPFQQDNQRVPTYQPPITEKTGRVVDLGDRVRIDGKVFHFK